MRIPLLIAVLCALAAPGLANAESPLPWTGGVEVVTVTEARLAAAASDVAGRPVQIRCEGESDWATLSQQAGHANGLAGFVWFIGSQPMDFMELSPGTCAELDGFLAAPPAEECRTGSRTESLRTGWQNVKVRGARGTQVVRRPVVSTIERPVYGPCPQRPETVYALWTLAHESIHLSGEADEPTADCRGLQWLQATATKLGAGPRAAKAMAVYAADWYARSWASAKPEYYSPECRDGGALDLHPELAAWPA